MESADFVALKRLYHLTKGQISSIAKAQMPSVMTKPTDHKCSKNKDQEHVRKVEEESRSAKVEQYGEALSDVGGNATEEGKEEEVTSHGESPEGDIRRTTIREIAKLEDSCEHEENDKAESSGQVAERREPNAEPRVVRHSGTVCRALVASRRDSI
ncbi:hypothetical protein HG530_000395 [Fusarium avenaceum]|nr:hypothetical protein HG530_000395 [Fusarium avenaceum]